MDEELLNKLEEISGQNKELIFSQVFHDTIKGSEWLPSDFPLSPGRGALGYPALYVLYRILNEFRPKSILEAGMGQSTKVIGLYNKWNTECIHRVVEHDPDWISFFCNHFSLPETTEVVELPIMDAPFNITGTGENVTMYKGFAERLSDKKYDFICVDGPYGFRSPQYARIDILPLLPNCLTEEFVIMLDDCDRQGELNTLRLIKTILDESGIKCGAGLYKGEKHTGLVVSENLGFMLTM